MTDELTIEQKLDFANLMHPDGGFGELSYKIEIGEFDEKDIKAWAMDWLEEHKNFTRMGTGSIFGQIRLDASKDKSVLKSTVEIALELKRAEQ